MKTKIIKLFAITVLALLTANCSNFLGPMVTPQKETGQGLLITVSHEVQESRTLYPSANFDKFILSFEKTEGTPDTHADVTLTDEASIEIDDLSDGTWIITAVGWVTIGGTPYAAAEGSETVEVSSISFQSVNIEIEAEQGGDDGFFSYSINFPLTKGINNAWLNIRNFFGGYDNSFNLLTNPINTIVLPPGYYMMTIQLHNDYQYAGHAEIVHIYSNLETIAEYTFIESDFVDFITLSGIVDITINGTALADPEDAFINAYFENNYVSPGYCVGSAHVDLSTGEWSMKIPALDNYTTLFFWIGTNTRYGWLHFDINKEITIKDHDEYINLGMVTIKKFRISGTINITINENIPDYAEVIIYKDAEFQEYITGVVVDLSTNEWSVILDAFDEDTNLYFTVYAQEDSFNGSKSTGKSMVVKDTDDSIDLGTINFSNFTISGTANITVNGNTPDYAAIEAYSDDEFHNHIKTAVVDLSTGTWSMIFDPFDEPTILYFKVYAQKDSYSGTKNTGKSITVKDTDDSIDLGAFNISKITIGGTVDVKVGGEAPDYAAIYAYLDSGFSNQVGSGASVNLSNGEWSIVINGFDTSTILYFRVYAEFNNYSNYIWKSAGSEGIHNIDKDNIDLGSINMGISISGIIDATVNGASAAQTIVYASLTTNDWEAQWAAVITSIGEWNMVIPNFETDTTLYLFVRISDGNFSLINGIGSIIVKDENYPNIDLGTYNKITIGGTINLLVNGSAPAGWFTIRAYPNNGYRWDVTVNLTGENVPGEEFFPVIG